MSTQVEAVAEAAVEEVMVATATSPVVDQALIAQVVGDARVQGIAI